VIAVWCDSVTLSGMVGACQVFDKPRRIVPGITGSQWRKNHPVRRNRVIMGQEYPCKLG
jgi:hypothetical protein